MILSTLCNIYPQELYDTLPDDDGHDSKDDAKLADILKRLNSEVEEVDGKCIGVNDFGYKSIMGYC